MGDTLFDIGRAKARAAITFPEQARETGGAGAAQGTMPSALAQVTKSSLAAEQEPFPSKPR